MEKPIRAESEGMLSLTNEGLACAYTLWCWKLRITLVVRVAREAELCWSNQQVEALMRETGLQWFTGPLMVKQLFELSCHGGD